jgi:hypothetical protein
MFHAYDFYFRGGAKKPLTPDQQRFYDYCCENHQDICNEDTPDDSPVIVGASELYDAIEDYFA